MTNKLPSSFVIPSILYPPRNLIIIIPYPLIYAAGRGIIVAWKKTTALYSAGTAMTRRA